MIACHVRSIYFDLCVIPLSISLIQIGCRQIRRQDWEYGIAADATEHHGRKKQHLDGEPCSVHAPAEEPRRSHPVGVVELFTSQGLFHPGSKADAAMEKIANGLTWSRSLPIMSTIELLGWQDTLSLRIRHGKYAYAKTLGNSNVYTCRSC